jgi:hypothetical protein
VLVMLPVLVDSTSESVDGAKDHVVVGLQKSAVEEFPVDDLMNEVVGDGRILSSPNVVDPV